MGKEITLDSLATTVDSLAGDVRSLTTTTNTLASDLESLARMVAEGFSAMGDRFYGLETRMDSLEKEVRQTNQHIDRIVMPTLDSHAARIKDLEIKAV